jgi:hypothetical protein
VPLRLSQNLDEFLDDLEEAYSSGTTSTQRSQRISEFEEHYQSR